MIHSILIIGQSNMAGRGFMNEAEPIENDRLFVLRNGRWRPMYRPVNPDRVFSGVNLAESFADLYSRDHDVKVGIIPCADGGTCLDQWRVGGLLFDHACYMAELASRTSTIAAVLWHQGESDSSDERYPLYRAKLEVILDAFRERLGLHDVPFILGGLGDDLILSEKAEKFKNYKKVNEALESLANDRQMTGFVSAVGLETNPDKIHFSSSALREFGFRYYREFLKLEDKSKIFAEKPSPDDAIADELERI